MASGFTALVPRLTTARTMLRAVTPSDFPMYADIMAGPAGRFMGGPYARDEAWWDFAQLASGWLLHGHGGWAIERAADARHLGFVLLGLEPGDLEPELGFMLAPDAAGQGFAREAAEAVKAYALNV